MGMFDFFQQEGEAAAVAPTYDEVERRRALAQALMPTGTATTFGGGLSAIGGGLGSVLAGRKAFRMDTERAAEADKVMAGALGQSLISPSMSAPMTSQAVAPPPDMGADPYDAVTASLTTTESGGNWQAANNEVGSGGARGHFGRLQFGQARLEDAKRAGVIPDGMDPKAFMADPGAQRAVEQWHFGDIDKQADRLGISQHLGQDIGGIKLTPDAVRAMAHLGGIGGVKKFVESGGRYNPSDSFGTSLTDYAQKHGFASAGGATPTMQPSAPPPVNTALIRAMANPYLSPEQKQVLGGVMAQQQAMAQAQMVTPMQAAQYNMQAQQHAMGQEKHALSMAQAQQPPAPSFKTMSTSDGNVIRVNEGTGEMDIVYAGRQEDGWRPATQDEAAQYGAAAGQIGPDGKFQAINPPSGMTIETTPDGGMRLVQGAGVSGGTKPFTDAQSKSVAFVTRAEGALERLEPVANSLADRGQVVAGALPMGLGRGSQTEEFQVAETAGQEFLQAILRKDSGAAITEGEEALYGRTYLPQPGDNPARLEYKREARQRAIDALRASMSPAEILAMETAGQSEAPSAAPEAEGWQEIDGGIKIRVRQ